MFSVSSAVIFLLSCIFGYFYIKWRQIRSYWTLKGVPHSPPNIIFGSLTFLQRENPLNWFIRQHQIYAPAPYFGIWLFWKPTLVISSPELARNILVKDAENFKNRYACSGKSDPIGQTNIFTVKTIYADYSTDIIGSAAFGIAGDATLTGESPMRAVTREFMKYSLWRGISWNCIFFLPGFVDFFRFKFFPKMSTDYFIKVFNMIVEQRGGWQRDDIDSKDMVDALIKIRKEALGDGKFLTEEEVVAQAAFFLQGGFDATAVAMSFATYELAYNEDEQDRLYTELMEAKEKLNGSDFDYQTLVDLPFLNAVIKETLRKYPAMGWSDRLALNDYKVDENLTISKGTPCYINAGGLHYDPEYHPEPLKFNPERFLPENEKNIKPFTYMPFGEGPRSCIGLRFAYQTLRVGIAHLILNFRIVPAPGEPNVQQLKLCTRGILMAPNGVMTVNYEDRDH